MTLPIHAYTSMQTTNQMHYSRMQRLSASTYDGAILAAVALVDQEYLKVHSRAETIFQFAFAWVLNGLNTVSQLLLVWMLYVSVIERQEALFEDTGHPSIIERIQHHISRGSPLSKDIEIEADILRRCSADETMPYAHMLVVLLWFSRMLVECSESIEYARIIWRMKLGQQALEVRNILDDEDNIVEYKYLIVSIPWFMKVIISCFVTGTRVLTAVFLTWTSAKYLIMSNDMAHVLLKAVGLQFVVSLDELLFRSFSPGIFRRQVEHTHFSYPAKVRTLWQQWMSSMWKVVGVILLSVTMSRFVFFRVFELREQCREYYSVFPPAGAVNKGPAAPITEMFEFMMTR